MIILKNICFVLPAVSRKPIGGYKIVFEYANKLVEDNINVSIVFINNLKASKYHVPEFSVPLITSTVTKIEPRWFQLDKRIRKLDARSSDITSYSNDFDIVFATAATTVEFVKTNFTGCKHGYLIQDYETWENSEDYLKRTYSYNMLKIVVSSWLKDIVDKSSLEPSVLIPNAIDINKYKCITPINKRNKFQLGMLWHFGEHKGCKYALAAIEKAREIYPEIKLVMFGATKPDIELPSWVEFHLKASQDKTVEIYNKVSTFVCATIDEGFGLTGFEAMACGAVLVSTSYSGVKEYAIDGYNALLSPVKDIEALSKNIIRCIDDSELREKISLNGIKSGKENSWNKAINLFESACNNYIAR